jgi:hypothetical protein
MAWLRFRNLIHLQAELQPTLGPMEREGFQFILEGVEQIL